MKRVYSLPTLLMLLAGGAQADDFKSGFEGGVTVSEVLIAGNYSSVIVVCQQNTQLLMMTREAAVKGVPIETIKKMTPVDPLFQRSLPDVYSGSIDVNAGGLSYLNGCLSELINKVSAITSSQ